MRRPRKGPATAAAAAVLVGGLVSSAGADSRNHTSERFSVTQSHTVYFDLSTCKKTQIIKLNRVSVQFTKSVRARKVPHVHLRTVQRARRCPDTSRVVDKAKFGDVHPVFGCGGRCGANKTEAMGHFLGWPWVLNNGEPPFVLIAASARGRVTSRGDLLGHICTQIDFIGKIGCTSSEP